MIAKDIMTQYVYTVKRNNTIKDVIKIMKDNNIGFVVIEENKKAIGVVTDRDITISLLSNNINTTIEKIMKRHVITINKYSLINDVSDLLGNMQIRRLVVVDENEEICGVIAIADLARHVLLEDNALEAITEISYDFSPKNNNIISFDINML